MATSSPDSPSAASFASDTTAADDDHSLPAARKSSSAFALGRYQVGLFLLVLVSVIWVTASYIVKSALNRGIGAFFFTYICNSLFILYLPLYSISSFVARRRRRRAGAGAAGAEGGAADGGDGMGGGVFPTSAPLLLRATQGRGPTARAWRAGLWVSPFWFLAQLTYNQSLKRTSVASNTIISSSSAVFTFIISYFLLDETISLRKIAAIALSFAGTVLVALGDRHSHSSSDSSDTLWGDALALISVVLYALYTVILKMTASPEQKLAPASASVHVDTETQPLMIASNSTITSRGPHARNGDGVSSADDDDSDAKNNDIMDTVLEEDEEVPMALVLGFLGFFNAVLMAPILGGLLIANVEATPTNVDVYLITIGKGLIDNVLSDFLWARAIILTNPVVATLGLGMQIPLAVAIDSFRGTAPSFLTVLGGLAIIVGFVVINLPIQKPSAR